MTTQLTGPSQFHGTEPVLCLRDVTKVYRNGSLEVAALRGVTLDVQPGEYVAVMGPSGSGKSTLMHIIGCLDVPSAGSYRLAGEDVSSMSENDLADVRNRSIGFVFQQFNLLASMTAASNVALPLAYAGVSRAQRRERAEASLARVGLADRVGHRPGELSWPTSPPATWTPPPPRTSWTCWTSSMTPAARSCSSPTSTMSPPVPDASCSYATA